MKKVLTAIIQPVVMAVKTSVEDIQEELDVVRVSRTGRLWVDCFITPVIIIHLFLRAEREGDWLLHMYSLKRMVPYLFAAGYWNYARYISRHILEMETLLPEEILAAFLRGEHVCRHHSGFWNAIVLDQFGEQTYIRYGKTEGGLVGKSQSSEQVSEWVLSHHICNAMTLKMDNMFTEEGEDDFDKKGGRHKEEGKKIEGNWTQMIGTIF